MFWQWEDTTSELNPSSDLFKEVLDFAIKNELADIGIQSWRGFYIISNAKEAKMLNSFNKRIVWKVPDFVKSCIKDILWDEKFSEMNKLTSLWNDETKNIVNAWRIYRYYSEQDKKNIEAEWKAENSNNWGVSNLWDILKWEWTKNIDIEDKYWKKIRLRCTCYKEVRWYAVNIRIWNVKVRWIEELHLEEFKDLLSFSSWLIIISGFTGQWKTTIINSLLNYVLHKQNKHLITLEDPVELLYNEDDLSWVVSYLEVWENIKTFKDWILASLRMSPNIIMIWEIRDSQTAAACLDAVMWWHLVITSVHADWASSTIQRFLQFLSELWWNATKIYMETFAKNLRGILYQNLVKTTLYMREIVQNEEWKKVSRFKKDENWRAITLWRTIPIREILYNSPRVETALTKIANWDSDWWKLIKSELWSPSSSSNSLNDDILRLLKAFQIAQPWRMFSWSNDKQWLTNSISENYWAKYEDFLNNSSNPLRVLWTNYAKEIYKYVDSYKES